MGFTVLRSPESTAVPAHLPLGILRGGQAETLLCRPENKANRHIEESPHNVAANAVICIVHRTNYLLGQQLANSNSSS